MYNGATGLTQIGVWHAKISTQSLTPSTTKQVLLTLILALKINDLFYLHCIAINMDIRGYLRKLPSILIDLPL